MSDSHKQLPELPLDEERAAHAFAKAWNRLEPDGFLELLDENARYASQWVFEELVGAAAIGDYLRQKMKTVRNHSINDPGSRVRAELGRTSQGKFGRPCAFLTQGSGMEIQAAVLFDVSLNRVARYDLCIPQVVYAVRSNVFSI